MKCDAAVAEKQILKFLHNRLWGYSYLGVALLFMKAGMAAPNQLCRRKCWGLNVKATARMHPSHQLIGRWVANDSVCAPALISKEICSRFSLMTRAVIKVANKSVGVEFFDWDQNLVSLINFSMSIYKKIFCYLFKVLNKFKVRRGFSFYVRWVSSLPVVRCTWKIYSDFWSLQILPIHVVFYA